jgi:hypothetical protein
MNLQIFLWLSLVAGLVSRAGDAPDPAHAGPKPEAIRDEAVRSQEAVARKFRDFQARALRQTQRLERQTGPADRARVAALRKAPQAAANGAFEAKIERAIAAIKAPGALGPADVAIACEQLEPLPEQLRAVLMTLAADRSDCRPS